MKYERAKTILTKRAEDYYGKTFDWIIESMDNGFDENMTVTQAYEAYKMHNGHVWCGIDGVDWVLKENLK